MPFTLWFTGLPASGKTTLSRMVAKKLEDENAAVELLDSDDFAVHLGEYVDGSPRGREINTRCMAVVSRFLNRHNIICIAASTSPRRENRRAHRRLVGNYIEVYCKCPVETAKKRDPKGLYRLAGKGVIQGFPGAGAVYEAPLSPEITVDTAGQTIDQCVESILEHLDVYKTDPSYKKEKISEAFNERG